MAKKNTILVVDDEEINRKILKKILLEDYQVLEASNGKEALDIMQSDPDLISAVVLDLIMPVMSGFELLEKYNNSENLKNIPIIVSPGDRSEESETKCLELGAWDFLRKPYNVKITKFRVRNVIERSQLHVLKEMQYMQQFDSLTGLYKKNKFFTETKKMLMNNPTELFVMVRVDIEKFQLINAFYGMQEGDKLLIYIAEQLRKREKEYEHVTYGRIEADVFCYCIPYNKNLIQDGMKRIRTWLNEYNLTYNIVPVFGLYVIENRYEPLDSMYDKANLAAKECKGNYIKNYEYYREDMRVALIQEQNIVNTMQDALKNEEFVLYLQPKYDLHTNFIDGAEALVRWIDPRKGMISPGEFIPVFERNGFIMQLDYYVWDHACQIIRGWLDEKKNPHPISVNISRVSLYNPELVSLIIGLVEKYDFSPSLLQLELTESAYTSNPIAIKEAMAQLQEYGFKILMDDFGSGYSSLNVLKDIAVDILKIDMKFMSDTDTAGRGENILASVVRMAKWLNMPVIAEGVEKEEQVLFLRSIGCEYVQGYYFARPMPVSEYEKLAFENREFHKSQNAKKQISTDSLWTSTSQMEILFSNMTQAVAILEVEPNKVDLIRVNDAYYDMFGFEDMSEHQMDFMQMLDSNNAAIVRKALDDVIQNGKTSSCSYVRIVEDSPVYIYMKLKHINMIGEKHIVYADFLDVTEQRAIDQELQKYRQAISSTEKSHKTILIVDDGEVNRAVLASVLEEKYQILQAENGKQAYDMVKNKEYTIDLLLLDIRMPVMDGNEFLQLRNMDELLKNIPVIIISSDGTANKQSDAIEKGANDYIIKPFVPEVVMKRVENVLNSNRKIGEALKTMQMIE